MLPEHFNITPMTRKDLYTAIDWAAGEGWNPGVNDTEIFWQTDPEGYIALKFKDELIGSGSIVSYNRKFGFMGFFIVKPEYRGKGLGTDLWFYRRDKLIERLKPDAPIGMDGVIDMQAFYAKGGFEFAHRNLRMEGVIVKLEAVSENVRNIDEFNMNEVFDYDTKHFGFDRKYFTELWLNSKEHFSFGYNRWGKLSGIVTIRKCRKGYKIGPLFADNFEIAHELFKCAAQVANNETIYLDTPEVNKNALKLAAMYNMKECSGCARMYYNGLPDINYENIFGVTTFELG